MISGWSCHGGKCERSFIKWQRRALIVGALEIVVFDRKYSTSESTNIRPGLMYVQKAFFDKGGGVGVFALIFGRDVACEKCSVQNEFYSR